MDSGLNYKHPAFGGCKQLGDKGSCRVLKGWDFVGNTESGGKYTPDADPMDCKSVDSSHGTQVASVAAGDASFAKPVPWRGVAYKASILAYKVSGSCKEHGGVSTNATLLAIRRAASDGADVLNLSYGDFRSGGYADKRYAAALTAAMQRGALVTIASGNDGDYGPWFTEGAVAAPGVLSTAAVDVSINVSGADMQFNQNFPGLGGNGQQSTILSQGPLMFTTVSLSAMPAVAAKYAALKFPLQVLPAKPINGCLPLTNAAEMKGRVAIVERGNCTFAKKAAAAADAGAVAVIVFNNRTGMITMGFDETPAIPIWGVELKQGHALLKAAGAAKASSSSGDQQQQQHPAGTVKRNQPQITFESGDKSPRKQQQQQGGLYLLSAKRTGPQPYWSVLQPATFSSWGPAADLDMTPSISAPGSGMHTAAAGTSYTDVDGTSYSAPFLAGALALWRQARIPPSAVQAAKRPNGSSKGGQEMQAAAYAAFVSTAQPMDWTEKTGWAQPVARVGAGALQVDAAIENPTRTSPDHLLLRSNRATQTLSFTLNNAANSPITYKLGHRPAAAITLKDTWYNYNAEDLLKPLAAGVSYKVAGRPATSVTVQPRGTATVQATWSLSKQLMSSPLIYSGYITLTPQSSTLHSITTESAAAAAATRNAPGPNKPQLQAAGGSSAGAVPVPYRAVPLVVPYQGFSQNYTTLPLLPEPNMQQYPKQAQSVLKGLLRVCYADYAHDVYDYGSLSSSDKEKITNQDGFLFQPHVDRCLKTAANASAITKIPLTDIRERLGVVMVAAAMLRPALRMSLMLLDAEPCSVKHGGSGNNKGQQQLMVDSGQPPACVAGLRRGNVVGQVWRYPLPSRDFPGTLWSYYTFDFDGQVKLRNKVTDKVTGVKKVQTQKKYKMQLWLMGPLAAADKAAGEQYKTWKYDIPGSFMFV